MRLPSRASALLLLSAAKLFILFSLLGLQSTQIVQQTRAIAHDNNHLNNHHHHQQQQQNHRRRSHHRRRRAQASETPSNDDAIDGRQIDGRYAAAVDVISANDDDDTSDDNNNNSNSNNDGDDDDNAARRAPDESEPSEEDADDNNIDELGDIALDPDRDYDTSINSLIEFDSSRGAKARPAQRHGSHDSSNLEPNWCSADCAARSLGGSVVALGEREISARANLYRGTEARVCASNGRFYRSMCELRREICRSKSASLFRVAASFCRQRQHSAGSPAVASSSSSLSPSSSSSPPGADRLAEKWRARTTSKRSDTDLRLIELKRKCRLGEFNEMKVKLLQHFNGDLDSMFRYFDADGDNFIEARELWPKRDNRTDRLRYAQIWAEHVENCAQHTWRHDNKCWYKLDFAFEPAFAQNPCSLSHLMLFDLDPRVGDKFDYKLFTDAFRRQVRESPQPEVKVENIRRESRVVIELGQTRNLSCLTDASGSSFIDERLEADEMRCLWTRYNLNLASIESTDSHVAVERKRLNSSSGQQLIDLQLQLSDAQLYLSGQFKCVCHLRKKARNFVHQYTVQVLAKPRVLVRPESQWSLPGSRVSFECHHDYVDTSFGENASSFQVLQEHQAEHLRVDWFKNDKRNQIVDSKQYDPSMDISGDIAANNSASADGDDESFYSDDSPDLRSTSQISSRASIAMASSRLTLESLKFSDSGEFICNVELPIAPGSDSRQTPSKVSSSNYGSLLVRDQPQQAPTSDVSSQLLWMFHDNGISIYRLQNDDGQEMELVREINGHSLVDSQVDGNWNQLTLCGGLNQEQVVICEWSDNAVHIDVGHNNDDRGGDNVAINGDISGANGGGNFGRPRSHNVAGKYVYVGQPNLNRVIVMDGLKFEIVAIINTEPQPRKLFSYKPNKIHLSKWVRRRLSPKANARWLSSLATYAHPLESAPSSQLYSNIRPVVASADEKKQRRVKRLSGPPRDANLVQHDIWLLCYGQPLVLDPSGDEHLEDSFYRYISAANASSSSPLSRPFTPRLSQVGGRPSSPFVWPTIWSGSPLNRESRLRNRKSVHIIQSTFFPRFLSEQAHHHRAAGDNSEASTLEPRRNETVVSRFKKSTVITTHHVLSSSPPPINSGFRRARQQQLEQQQQQQQQKQLQGNQFDLIQDLSVPMKPYPLELENGLKIHYAYITHYDENSLFRVSMDAYHYDKEIDLQDCDPISLIVTAQGQLVVQCRASIAHNLIGQLVLDQLTNSRIEFNANVRAQEAYLSPDHRYLVSIFSEKSTTTITANDISSNRNNKRAANKQSSIIYVQLVTVSGLKLQYEIKTSLDICQCSFVWKDGYYAAIFVSTNHRDQQSEILNLRLADGRLELMARVPGIVNAPRHREHLLVSPELRVAALSTNQGTFVIDLEDNRVSQSLRHHQSPAPTLLWV